MSFDPAATRQVGRTKLRVSQLGFGAAPFGNLLADMTDEAANASVAAAIEAGVSYFDTAPFYGHGLSEHRLGAALRRHPRDKFVLSTKVGRLLKPDPAVRTPGPFATTLPFDIVYDYSRDGALRSIEDSLQRLGTSHIDIVFIHDVTAKWRGDALEATYKQAMDGAYQALADLRAAGTIGAIGVGINDVDLMCRFATDGDFDCFMLAGRYTLLDTTAHAELLPICEKKSISILLAAPYHSGILATGAVAGAKYWYADAPQDVLDRVRKIEAVCARHGVSLQAAATQFPLLHPRIASIAAGYRSTDEVRAALKACAAEIPSAMWRELKAAGLIDPAVPTG
ncbi:MAG: aldo/keto reductase [Alphaproteobacteria bacterium]|nr:aldo/keto reductase [Alphaproteobacteria bacterium]